MPEESTFRKYACPKLKLARLLLDNLFRILVQNLPALGKLNSKKHTPSPTVWFLRNCGIAQNLSFAKTVKGNFARNDFCQWLRKLLFFRAKLMRKERKILRFVPQILRNSFANENPTCTCLSKDKYYFIRNSIFISMHKRFCTLLSRHVWNSEDSSNSNFREL